ncbi:MAG: hypothetical protein ACKVRN_04735 [Pyrinomonadaceae bacterium]
MIYVKIFAMVFSLIGFGSWAWLGQASKNTQPAVKEIKTIMPEVSPEVRKKAFRLLNEVMAESAAIEPKTDSIKMRFLLTDLLWEEDEQRARTFFLSLASEADKEIFYYDTINLARIAGRDAKLAYKISESSRSLFNEYDEAEVYYYFVEQYPDEAFLEAKRDVEANNYLPYVKTMYNTIGDGKLGKLYAVNRGDGANLARAILKKLSGKSLQVHTPYRPSGNFAFNFNVPPANWTKPVANFANLNTATNRLAPTIDSADERVPLSAAAALLNFAVRAGEEAKKTGDPVFLSESEIKELANWMAISLRKARKFDAYFVRTAYQNLKKYATVEFARFERSLSLKQRKEIKPDFLGLFDTPSDIPLSGSLFDIEPTLPQPANTSTAKTKLKIEGESDMLDRISLLTSSAVALVKKNDLAGAKKLFDEIEPLVPTEPKNKEEFFLAENYALSLAKIEPTRGFVLAEKLLDRANRLLNISRELRDFTGGESEGSANFEMRRRQIADNSSVAIEVIRVLSHADFERTVRLADRFTDPDQRLFFRWYIANALLNKNAADEEEKFSSSSGGLFDLPPSLPGIPYNK